MDYNKLTKAELIEELQQSISLEKYNKLQKILEGKDRAIDDLKAKIDAYSSSIDKIELKSKNNSEVLRNQLFKLKEDYDYLETIVDSEHELVELLYKKSQNEQEFGDKLYKLYHKTLFKENDN
jgi:Na+/phosphate symporter